MIGIVLDLPNTRIRHCRKKINTTCDVINDVNGLVVGAQFKVENNRYIQYILQYLLYLIKFLRQY
ncbi:hypothetical protein I3842_12G120200 [Carya illinoinensis]|uniref:Uncharacterized protein n=1 Tax=Carya illinoinensis TaxID=32201 RepID=A0A922DJJ2_CARIL|nr:hypothetical protein I3842_12G120200 [Carya illinoinensis]